MLQLVHQIRARQPRIGTRKLHHLLAPQLEKLSFAFGRDALFELLGRHQLLVPRRKRTVRTTEARHQFGSYPNLLAGEPVARIHQAWVADITYLDTEEGFVYLALLTDVYSRRILGFDVSDSLAVEGALRALEQAGKLLPKDPQGRLHYPLLHHSDRGVQYACNAYTDWLKTQGIAISMAAAGSVYENALAERVNGILKLDFLLGEQFGSVRQAMHATRESIAIYNLERPHLSLDYQTPDQRYQQSYAQWYPS